jgi:KaiC/GvpD/RAD55 family RecA-like ATPase
VELKDAFKKLDENKAVLIIAKSSVIQDTAYFAASTLAKKIGKGIYVALNKSAESVAADLKKSGTDTGGMSFVDTISSARSGESGWKKNIYYMAGLEDITEMSITVSNFIAKTPGKKWVLLDAVTTLKLYTTEDMLAKFVQTLTLRAGPDVWVVVVATSMKDDTLSNKIIPFFDEVVTVE